MPQDGSLRDGFLEALGPRLIDSGALDAAGLERAARLREDSGERLDRILVKLGLVSERQMAEAFAAGLDLPLASPDDYPEDPPFADRVSPEFLKDAKAIPLSDEGACLVLAVADPLDPFVVEALRLRLGREIDRRVGVPADIEAALSRAYSDGNGAIEGILADHPEHAIDDRIDDLERLKDSASEAPVIRLVNHLIDRAVELRASDIHIEPFETRLRVRYRIDGILREEEPPPNRLRQSIVSRVKIMAQLNIAETRLPQDGRIKIAVRGKEVDLRVSTVPTLYGESLVLRVLDRQAVALDFAKLGLDPDTRGHFKRILERPHGILLVTGPTGSGKTTTLYTSLLHLNTGERKILSVEDPVEYQLEGINQVQVLPAIGLGFAHALRAFLRQDPDIIMIGEIRDLETAEIAVQAALTGHLVLSTLHTNDAASTITRLLDMGAEDFLVASTLNGVVAQRLVRRLCPDCREPYAPAPEILDQLGLAKPPPGAPLLLYRATGCKACRNAGYRGRTMILEILVMSDALRALLLKRPDASEIQRAALGEGMRGMFQDGVRKMLDGTTSFEEVMRVTRET